MDAASSARRSARQEQYRRESPQIHGNFVRGPFDAMHFLPGSFATRQNRDGGADRGSGTGSAIAVVTFG
jgi:hypothetical protein